MNCKLKRKEKRGLLRDFAVVWYRIEPAEKLEAIDRNPQPVRHWGLQMAERRSGLAAEKSVDTYH